MRQKNFSLVLILLAVSAILSCTKEADLTVDSLTCNFRENPMGVDLPAPLFGWKIKSSERNIMQSAYRVVVTENPDEVEEDNGTLWDSGKIDSGQSVNVQYEGSKLKPGKRYFWKVKIWDEDGRESLWSEINWWQTGLFSEKDWQGARWVSYEVLDPSLRLVPGIHGSGDNLGKKAMKRPVIPQFRKTFTIVKELQSATLFISGLGHYEAYVNGQKVGDSFLTPGWTDYDKTVFYNTYDVTSFLKKDKNVLGAVIGNGFYNINRERYRKLVIAYGYPKLIAHLRLQYSDGSSEIITTDESWRTVPSPITYTSIYGGEDYDATREQTGWKEAGFDDSKWNTVILTDRPSGKLTAEHDYPLREMQRFEAERILPLGDTAWLYDFGQNASGIVELTVKGEVGQEVKLWPGELINPDNTVNQRASGRPYYFSYILNGKG